MRGKKARGIRRHLQSLDAPVYEKCVAYRVAKALHPVASPKIDAQALKRRRKSMAAQRERARARRS